ncbi:hypothetical protein MTLP_07780 [Candidatus Methanoliparum sp. LAM-1]|nr:hypothetical protein MTLP_07780 [Candidatus Methanoliparum sp. LAM-1]
MINRTEIKVLGLSVNRSIKLFDTANISINLYINKKHGQNGSLLIKKFYNNNKILV